MARREELTDEQWAVIAPLTPEPPRREDGRGRPWLATVGIEMIAPHRDNRIKPATQDGRPLRRYREGVRKFVYTKFLTGS